MGFVTSEKLVPSPLTIVSEIGQAIDVERRMTTSRSRAPLKDCLAKVIADFNKMVTIKKHRIDSARRSLCYNLLLGSDGLEKYGLDSPNCFSFFLGLPHPSRIL